MTKNNSSLSKVKFEVDKLNYSDLQANKNVSDKINFPKGKFIINNQPMNLQFINDVYNNEEKKLKFIEEAKRNAQNDLDNEKIKLELIKNSYEDGNQFSIDIFKNRLKNMKLPIPSDYIIQELITSCYLYESFITTNVLLNSNLTASSEGHNQEIHINFITSNCVEVKVDTEGKFFIDDETKGISQSHGSGLLSLSSSLEFRLGSNNNKEEVEYTDGKLSLTVTPNSLEVEKGQNLFSKAIEVIKELLEKLFGKERVTMKEYKFEFNEPKSIINKPKVHNVYEQEKSAEK